MNLSPDQKKWCEAIIKGNIISSETFLVYIGLLIYKNDIKKAANDVVQMIYSNDFTKARDFNYDEYTFNLSVENWPALMKEFLSLWCYLEKENMVISFSSQRNYVPVIDGSEGDLENLPEETQMQKKREAYFYIVYYNIFGYNDYSAKTISPLLSLDRFVKNDYITDKELEFEAQKNAYENQRITNLKQLEISEKTFETQKEALAKQDKRNEKSLKRSTVAMWTSIIVGAVSIGFNIYTAITYTKERKVEIINLDSAMEKYSRAAVDRARYEDSIAKAHAAARDTSFARAGKRMIK